MRPSGVVCRGCNGQFFAASLVIHQKTCFQRNDFVEITCPSCREVVLTGKYHAHVSGCSGPPPPSPHVVDNELIDVQELNPVDVDGRVRCKSCDRAFAADRIAKHQSVCIGTRREAPTKPRIAARESKSHPTTTGLHTIKTLNQTQRVFQTAPRVATGVAQIQIQPRHVQLGFTGKSGRSSSSRSRQDGSQRTGGSENRYDLVHRDGGRGVGLAGLSTSTATSQGNPLATTRLMTVQSLR